MKFRALLCGFIALPWVAAHAAEQVYRCYDGTSISYQWARCEAHQVERVVVVPSAPEETRSVDAPKPPQGESRATPVANRASAAPDLNAPAVHTISPQQVATLTQATWRQQIRSPAPYVGISDDAVLNMRGWGRPTKINRMRENRAWVEEWSYVGPSGESRNLRFINGRLMSMDAAPAPYIVQVANAPEPVGSASGAGSAAAIAGVGVAAGTR
jgi:hypothetical protein